MKIIKCPHCKEYFHFDGAPKAERCWHCGQFTDFTRHQTFEQKILSCCDQQISRVLPQDLEFERVRNFGKISLFAALPVACAALLLCNSLDIFVVHDLADSFASMRIFGKGILACGVNF